MNSPITPADFDVVNFSSIHHPRLKVHPIYYQLGFSDIPIIYGRYAVLKRVLLALSYIPNEYGLLIYDIYRSRVVQGKVFEQMKAEVKKSQPHLSDQALYTETTKYASPPYTEDDHYCPPHLSGGAIDLTLFKFSDNQEANMGTPFDDCTERAHKNFFENRNDLTHDEIVYKKNRNILCHAMESAGFTSCIYEWWHYDIGNMLWEKNTGQKAVFGPLFGNEEWPPEIKAQDK